MNAAPSMNPRNAQRAAGALRESAGKLITGWLNATRAVPALSGLLIAAALIAGRLTPGGALRNALMIAATLVAGTPVLIKAYRAARLRLVSIDLLVSLAAAGALVIGEVWEAAAVTFLFALGHALEAATLDKTRSAIAELIKVAPDTAVVIRDGEQLSIPAGEVMVGETVIVKNGARIPVDGEVIRGSGTVDEATITGESLPAEKAEGSTVYAGTIAASGLLQIRAARVGADTTLARIIHRVEEAQEEKAATQRFMERFAQWYTPGIIALAALAGLMSGNAELGLTLLVIGCPGALVISIPVSIVAGIGRGAKDGVLIKGGEHLEAAAKVTAVAFDKTGTLTQGKPTISHVVPLQTELSTAQLLHLAARVEAGSEHPLAGAVIEASLAAGGDQPQLPDETEPVPGMGVVGVFSGERVMVGNARLLEREVNTAHSSSGKTARPISSELVERALSEAERLARSGSTPMIIAENGTPLGLLGVTDSLRPGAKNLIQELRKGGIERVIMLTGDSPEVARAVARQVGIAEVRAGLLPEEKLQAVRELMEAGEVVAMVGDGVNDAPALAAADIGVAMGAAASPVALETADIALLGADVDRLPKAVLLARRTVRNMRQNIALALATVALLLAGVLLGRVSMAGGMLVHEGSVLLVILNGMRLLAPDRRGGAIEQRAAATPRTEPLPST